MVLFQKLLQNVSVLAKYRCINERGFCLLKGIAEGTYNSKHAEAARLYYTTTTTSTTTHIHTHTPTEL